uniref:Uncharacterized protein n=1 Tax=Mycena chlorophos TaxID=658473 RepID=A0ABQ0LLL1_MYCCL|nr:predicted protein [Mycena chlorophos]
MQYIRQRLLLPRRRIAKHANLAQLLLIQCPTLRRVGALPRGTHHDLAYALAETSIVLALHELVLFRDFWFFLDAPETDAFAEVVLCDALEGRHLLASCFVPLDGSGGGGGGGG